MMAKRRDQEDLLMRLPAVKGRIRANVSLAPMSWFRAGGAADILFEPSDADDLVQFLAGCPEDIPVSVLGVGSNCLVRDGGIPGVVVRLRQGFAHIHTSGRQVTAGAGALDFTVARRAAAAGLSGLEFLVGVPGCIGGALRMNAGAYGREMKDVLQYAHAIDRKGGRHRVDSTDLNYSYRHSDTPAGWIFVDAVMQVTSGDPVAITTEMESLAAARSETQPILARTGGSTFKNPPEAKAWELIDRAGCRGLRMGGAMVSEQHCNFLINHDGASADEIERLGEEVRRRVFAESGVQLEWEIQRLGRHGRTDLQLEEGGHD